MFKPESLFTRTSEMVVGPFHPGLPGAMKLRLTMDGETIVHADVETGFYRKGVEALFLRTPWFSAMVPADRIDPEAAVSYELAFCMAVEGIGNIQVPRRAQAIRVILCELARVCSHLNYLARIALSVGFDTTAHYVLREREQILDLFELMTGSRFNPCFLRYGGVRADITEGFIERIFEVARIIQVRLREYHSLMIENQSFIARLAWLGAAETEQVLRYGVTGPNARAAGLHLDARKNDPYSGYEAVNFQVPIGMGAEGTIGDCFDRLRVRLEEIGQSLSILTQVADAVPPGDYASIKVLPDFTVPAGEYYSRVEGARGLIGCHVVSEGGLMPSHVQWRTPSQCNLQLVAPLLRGTCYQDLPVILASLDLCLAEADR